MKRIKPKNPEEAELTDQVLLEGAAELIKALTFPLGPKEGRAAPEREPAVDDDGKFSTAEFREFVPRFK
jgi:hypothetical protein